MPKKASLRRSSPVATEPVILLAFNWHDERVIRGVYQYAKEHRWHLPPYSASADFVPIGWTADAAITCYGPKVAPFIDSLSIPMVDITIEETPRPTPRVLVDNEAIGRLAAEHFLARGYRNFAFYSWPHLHINQLRMRTFFNALIARGIPQSNLLSIIQSEGENLSHWDLHQKDILRQIQVMPRPLAVFAGQDNLGANLIEICTANRIHVPEEIAVLGVDNNDLLCESSRVALSSIETDIFKLGYEAARRLHQLLRGEITRNAETVLIPPVKIVTRQSTDVLAVAHPAVLAALRYMKQNYQRPITIEDIISSAGLSMRGLEKAFQKHLGRSPAQELRRLRLDEVKRRLSETDHKIEAIALGCGYSNSSNLSCAFRKETGMTPRSYRLKFTHAE